MSDQKNTRNTAEKITVRIEKLEGDSDLSKTDGFENTVPKAFLEINGGDHLCVMNGDQFEDILGKYGVAWMKVFLDNDQRYMPFLCGPDHEADWDVSDYRSSCPY